VLIIGLGQLGLPAAKYVKENGFETYCYDASIEALERAERTAGIKRAYDFMDLMYTLFAYLHMHLKICSHPI
jgi:3-hydroxyisobutyrate dehydrogenase-like beta-hydroxyacid dehydrogenase